MRSPAPRACSEPTERLRTTRIPSTPTTPSAGRLPAGRPDLLRCRGRPGRPRRAVARQRNDRSVLVEWRRLEHPTAGRVRVAYRVGALEARWLSGGARGRTTRFAGLALSA